MTLHLRSDVTFVISMQVALVKRKVLSAHKEAISLILRELNAVSWYTRVLIIRATLSNT